MNSDEDSPRPDTRPPEQPWYGTWYDAERAALDTAFRSTGSEASVEFAHAALAAEQGSAPLRATQWLESASAALLDCDDPSPLAMSLISEVKGWIAVEHEWDPKAAETYFDLVEALEKAGVQPRSSRHFRLRIEVEAARIRHQAYVGGPRTGLTPAESRRLSSALATYLTEDADQQDNPHRLSRLLDAYTLLGQSLPSNEQDLAGTSRHEFPHVWGLIDAIEFRDLGSPEHSMASAKLAMQGYLAALYAPGVAHSAAVLGVAARDARMYTQRLAPVMDPLVLSFLVAHEHHPLYRIVKAELRRTVRDLNPERWPELQAYWAELATRLEMRDGLFASLSAWKDVPRAFLPEVIGLDGTPHSLAVRLIREVALGGVSASDPLGDITGLLSPREQEVVNLIVFGAYSDKQIAEVLRTSTKTVEKYVGIALRKFGCTSRTQLAFKLSDYL